jgi:UDP-N-acetylmuramate dehydrogenase
MFASGRRSCLVLFYRLLARQCRLEPMQITERQLLAPLTTFGIGGPARWFTEAASESEIVEANEWARRHNIPLFVLGGGSNVLVADAGFDGLVIHVGLKGIERDSEIFKTGAGNEWDQFVDEVVTSGYAGIECLAGIPGTVGGTPVQNVGAYGQEVAPVIEQVRAFDLHESRFVEFLAAECGFGYRKSRFNSVDRGRYIVTRVDFRLKAGGAPTVRYADLQQAMKLGREAGAEPSLTEVAAVVRQIRRGKGMLIEKGDANSRSAGSFFKNPVVSKEVFSEIGVHAGCTLPNFPAGIGPETEGKVKIPAAWLIEQAGFSKGYALGHAGISTRHTLALTNRGGAKAEEILTLAGKISAAVEARFGVRLQMEPEMVGF